MPAPACRGACLCNQALMRYLGFVLLILSAGAQAGNSFTLDSPTHKVVLVELYTSEGCSSCPPADRWLSRFAKDPGLWREIIPLGFHVDYWDYLGWKDRFAHAKNSYRQNRYKAEKRLKTVYTPGFVVDGKEWRGWFGGKILKPENTENTGVLTVKMSENKLEAAYAGTPAAYVFNFAVLGFGITSSVENGENQGKNLIHDFVVLFHHYKTSPSNQAVFDFPKLETGGAKSYALAVWINSARSLAPVQAVGGYLPNDLISAK